MIIFIILWLICSFFSYGILFADSQHFSLSIGGEGMAKKYYRENLSDSLFLSLFLGPLALIISFFVSGFCEHGFKIK
ncbi:MAG: hypothetical protein WC737_05575 [Parcubacteria group bacterium]|jgi:hypothetical protein